MQDSLEDFIRISRNCKEGPTQVKSEVLITAQIKKECDAKAMQIFQFAIEGRMRPDALFTCLPYINQLHYQDIVEERALSRLCGYPLCSKRIPEMPKKQFYISTKNNKVYNITDRKNFCSNFCYRASIHIKTQIDTSPLWMRKHNERVQFTVLNKTEKGLPGEEVDQGVTKPVEGLFTSVSSFAQMSLDEAEELEMKPDDEDDKGKVKKKRKIPKQNSMKTIEEEQGEERVSKVDEEKSISEESGKETEHDKTQIKEEVCDVKTEMIEESQRKAIQSIKKAESDRQIEEKNKAKRGSKVKEEQVLKCFKEWLTLETYIYIYGEQEIKSRFNNSKINDFLRNLKLEELQIEQKKKYTEICRRMNFKDLEDEKFDLQVLGNKRKPIPNYQVLKEESKDLDLRVKAFYQGEMQIKENKEEKVEKVDNEEEGTPPVLPLVDTNSQNALRRKIFLNSLNKTVQTLFQTLKLSPNMVMSDLTALVKTFRLKADNIVFKPQMWNCVVVILLKVLTLKEEDLKTVWETERVQSQLDHFLHDLPNRKKVVESVFSLIQDVDSFVEDYICK